MASELISIDCGTALNISGANALFQQLQKVLEESSNIELVADSVEKVDTAGLQILVALYQEIERVDGSVYWKQPSDFLKQASVTLGLAECLGLD